MYIWLLSCCKAYRYKIDIFTFNYVTHARYGKRGSSHRLKFYFLKINNYMYNHLLCLFYAWIIMKWSRYSYIWRSINVYCTCIIILTKGNTIFYLCFQAHAYFEAHSKTTMRLKSWKMKTTPNEIRATMKRLMYVLTQCKSLWF